MVTCLSRVIGSAVVVLFAACAHRGPSSLGPLPPGAISHSEAGPTAEVILYIAVDPAVLRERVPAGLRLRTLKERAERDPDVAAYLEERPEHATWASSFFEIIRSDYLEYDGVRSGPGTSYAVWYVYVARTDETDPQPRGGQMLELGTWMSDAKLAEHMIERGYPVEVADVQLRRTRNRVYARLSAGDLRVIAEGEVYGRPRKAWWPEPAWQTIWSRPELTTAYEIITFRGHKILDARIDWQMEGEHLLAEAFRARLGSGSHVGSTEYAYDYILRGGLYARRR